MRSPVVDIPRTPAALVSRVRELIERRPVGGEIWWAVEEVPDAVSTDPALDWWSLDVGGPTVSLGAGDDVVEFGLLDPTAADGWIARAPDGVSCGVGPDRDAILRALPATDGCRVVRATSSQAVQRWLEDLVGVWRSDLTVVADPEWAHHRHPLAWILEREHEEAIPWDLDAEGPEDAS